MRAWCDGGKLAYIRTPGGQRRISEAAIEDLMTEAGDAA